MPNTSLPMSVDEITAHWFSAALQVNYPGVVVTDLQVRNIIWGTATKVLVDLSYNHAGQAAGLPATLYVKGGFDPGLLAMVGPSYTTEALFYRDIAPQLDVSVPASFYADYDSATHQAIILMEDLTLRDVVFGNPTQDYTPEQVDKGLEQQARWHARWWNDKELVAKGLLKVGNPGLRQVMEHLMQPDHWDMHLSMPKAGAVHGDLRKLDKVYGAFKNLWADDDRALPCFLHGDTHIGNTYSEPDGAVRFLDWQTVMMGPWSHDVAIFLAGSLSPKDRKDHEKELLQRYLGKLRDYGVEPPSFKEAWNAYVSHILHGFLWVMTPEEMQPQAYVAAMTERYAVACDELGTLALLK